MLLLCAGPTRPQITLVMWTDAALSAFTCLNANLADCDTADASQTLSKVTVGVIGSSLIRCSAFG